MKGSTHSLTVSVPFLLVHPSMSFSHLLPSIATTNLFDLIHEYSFLSSFCKSNKSGTRLGLASDWLFSHIWGGCHLNYNLLLVLFYLTYFPGGELWLMISMQRIYNRRPKICPKRPGKSGPNARTDQHSYLGRIWGCPNAPEHGCHVWLTARSHVLTRQKKLVLLEGREGPTGISTSYFHHDSYWFNVISVMWVDQRAEVFVFAWTNT